MNNKHITSIQQIIQKNPALKNAIIKLIEKSIQSPKGIIPVFEDEKINSFLLQHGIVKPYSSSYYSNHFKTQPSNILAHVAYHYFKNELETPEIKAFTDVEAFIKKLDVFTEKHPNSLGISSVSEGIPVYLYILINQNFNYQFDHVLKISDKKNYKRWGPRNIASLEKALPFLTLTPKRIVDFVAHCIQIGGADGPWYDSIKKRYEEEVLEAWEVLNLAKSHTSNLQFLIAHILQAISKHDFPKAFHELESLVGEPRFVEGALFGFSSIQLINDEWIKKLMNLMKPLESAYPQRVSNVYSNILKSKSADDAQLKECLSRLENLLKGNNLEIKDTILYHFSTITFDEKWLIEILKNYCITGDSVEKSLWRSISYLLEKFKSEQNQFEVLSHFIEKFPKENVIEFGGNLFQKISKEVVSIWITKWFNDDRFVFNLRASEVVRAVYTGKENFPRLSKKYLDNYSIWDIEYIVRKILGFVIMHQNLTGLIFSVLQRSPEDKSVNSLVESSFINHILFNYSSPVGFLKGKIKTGTQLEKKIARKIVKQYNAKEKEIRALPRLKELEGSEKRIREYMKRQSKDFDMRKSIMKGSVFFQLTRNIDLKAGKGFFNKSQDGNYSTNAPLTNFQSSFELPRGEYMDPTGQEIFRISCQTFKRKQ